MKVAIIGSGNVGKALAGEATKADPRVDGTNLDAFVAGDDEEAKTKAQEFARSIGFRPLDAGPLSMARALEGMALLNILLQIKKKWPWQSGWKMVGPTGEKKSSG